MQRLNPKSVWLFFLKFVSSWFFFFLFFGWWLIPSILLNDEAVTFGSEKLLALNTILFVLAVIVAIGIIYAKLSYHFYRYELGELVFKKEHGIIWKKYVSIPYDRIQNVDIYRGILARIFGLSDLQIQTAGASGGVTTEGRLPGLSREIA